MIIAVDFDNTIARTTFPEIHGEIPGAVDVLTRFQSAGHTVILWTCREGKVLNDALLWLAARLRKLSQRKTDRGMGNRSPKSRRGRLYRRPQRAL